MGDWLLAQERSAAPDHARRRAAEPSSSGASAQPQAAAGDWLASQEGSQAHSRSAASSSQDVRQQAAEGSGRADASSPSPAHQQQQRPSRPAASSSQDYRQHAAERRGKEEADPSPAAQPADNWLASQEGSQAHSRSAASSSQDVRQHAAAHSSRAASPDPAQQQQQRPSRSAASSSQDVRQHAAQQQQRQQSQTAGDWLSCEERSHSVQLAAPESSLPASRGRAPERSSSRSSSALALQQLPRQPVAGAWPLSLAGRDHSAGKPPEQAQQATAPQRTAGDVARLRDSSRGKQAPAPACGASLSREPDSVCRRHARRLGISWARQQAQSACARQAGPPALHAAWRIEACPF